MDIKKLSRLAAWGLVVAVVFVTVCPIEWRPKTETTVDLDRSLAFALTAFLFVLAYPERWKTVLVLFPLFAFGTEFLQFLATTRHPRLPDAAFKAFGAFGGGALGHVVLLSLSAWRRRSVPSA